MNDDLISRSELRARFQAIIDRGDMFCEYDIIGMVDNAQPVVAEKATSDRPTGKWVSVKDRLPEDRRIVLVTAYWHETYQVMEASYFGDGVWWCVPFNNCGDHMQQLKPKAWMELPEPYKEAENE